jgi:hypothetical protein
MKPIRNKSTFTLSGEKRSVMTLDPFCFMMNTFAMGDVIATAPVVKYAIENFYTTPESYVLVAKTQFRPFFPFVPDENFLDYDDKSKPVWGVPPNFAIGALNRKNESRIVRNTPKSMHLSTYASLSLLDRILPLEKLNYVPLDPVDITHFGIDWTNCVIMVCSYRDETRMWRAEHILDTARWLKLHGFMPVFVGKTDMDQHVAEHLRPKSSLPDDISKFGIDLRNKTTITELASIFREVRAVCGVDSGPIHLAGTTEVPIICGYTSVAPEHRIPTRPIGKTITLTAPIECIGCESRWRSNYWNYENCYLETAECSKQLTAPRFIAALQEVL